MVSITPSIRPSLTPAFGTGTQHRIKKQTDPNLDATTIDEDLVNIVTNALNAGFTHIDTAECYLTRVEIGEVLKRTGADRSKLWITDKWDTGWKLPDRLVASHSPKGPYSSLKKGLALTGLDQVDLFLIHAPFFGKGLHDIDLKEAWRQMEQIKEEGLARHIGVSNFGLDKLKEVLGLAQKYKAEVNQIEWHMYAQCPELLEFCKENGVLVEGFAPLRPLNTAAVGTGRPLEPVIEELCKKYNVEPNQLLLRASYQSGVLPITTSANFERMKGTFKMFEFELTPEDLAKLKAAGEKYSYRFILPEQFQ